MSRVPDIEYSALQMLIEGDKRVAEHGVTMWLAGLNPGAMAMVQQAGLAAHLGRERMIFNAQTAIERFLAQNNKPA